MDLALISSLGIGAIILGVAIDFFLVLVGKEKVAYQYAFIYVLINLVISFFTADQATKHLMNNVLYVSINFIVSYIAVATSFTIVRNIQSNVLYYFAFKILSYVMIYIIMFVLTLLIGTRIFS